jgi:hypothetical protein
MRENKKDIINTYRNNKDIIKKYCGILLPFTKRKCMVVFSHMNL